MPLCEVNMPKLKDTPLYIRNLLLPQTKSPQGRKVWSVDLETVWLPFLTATNTMGDTAIPLDALGAPIRLSVDQDGSVRFGKTGRPVTRVAKPIAESVSLIRQNFVATLQQYAQDVAESKQTEYAAQVAMSVKAGQPIIAHDKAELDKAIQLQIEQSIAEAQAEASEETSQAVPDKELVAVS